MGSFEKDLSQGHVGKQLMLFAFPFLISNLIQSLYSVTDMIIVGQFAGTASMSGVNIGGQVSFLLTNLVIGLAVGGTVMIGQYLGAGRRRELEETISTLFTTLLIIGVVFTVLTVVLRRPILQLIQTPAASFAEADSYLLVTGIGMIFVFAYNAFSAVMRGLGDSKRPLVFVAIACAVNVGLDLLCVAVFHWGAFGAALATIVSQAVSVVLCVIVLRRDKDFAFDFHPKSFRIAPVRLRMLLKVGIPTSVQNCITSISFLFLTAMVNTFDYTASAAVGAVGKLNGFAILPAVAMSASISAMAAQNLGAGKQKRAVKTMATGMAIAIAISAVIFAAVSFFPEPLLRLFADDDAMVAAGCEYMRAFRFDYLLAPVVFCFNGLFIGAGHTTFSLINGSLSAVLLRIPIAYIFGMAMQMGLYGVGIGAPAASAASLLVGLIFFLSGRWKKAVIVHAPPEGAALEAAEQGGV